MRGEQERFGVNGQATQQIFLVTNGLGNLGGYTNYYRYDLWGNLVYSRLAINPSQSTYHEMFSDYYNNGLPTGFYSFAETLSQANHTRTDNNWNITSGQWTVVNGEYVLAGERGNQSLIEVPQGDAAFQMTVRWLAGQYFEGYIGFRYQTNGNHYEVYLSAYDNTLRFVKVTGGTYTRLQTAAVTPSKNVHYVIRVESSRYTHTVYLNGTLEFQVTDQDGSMLTGRYLALGTYSSVSPTNAEQIGFSNIYVQPLPSTFSNSFFSTSPNSNVHGAPAGIAQLQNGIGSQSIETYLSYTTWGGLNQTSQLYNSGTGTRWFTTSRNYDNFGNLIKAYDSRGNATYYSYSPTYQFAYLTNMTQILKPGLSKISRLYSYNSTDGSLLSSVDPRGYNTTYHYDILDRPTRATFLPTGDYTAYSYNDSANYVNVTNEMGWKTQQFYDGLGRLSNATRFLNGARYSTESYTYNWQDRPVTETDPLGNKITYQYDALGRVILVTKPDLNTTSVSYNELASWTKSNDENGIGKCAINDRLGRLISVVENATLVCTGTVTDYLYDELGNLLKVTTANNQSTSYTYDDLNRLMMTAYSDTTFESYNYDSDGNLVRKTDRKGVQSGYQYDSLNRLTSTTYYGLTTARDSYSYDNDGNLVSLQSQNATLTYTYDQRNRVKCETYSVNGASTIQGPCGNTGGGGGGSVAAGTLITLANGTGVAVQDLHPGMELLAYNVTTGQYAVSTITAMTTVDTTDMLIILTQDGQPLRSDNATIQKLWVKQADGEIGWLSVTQLRTGDSLYIPKTQSWTMVDSIKDIQGKFVMYDIYTTAPHDYIANGYLDPVKGPIQGPTSPVTGGIIPAGYSTAYTYSGEELTMISYNDVIFLSYYYDGLGRVSSLNENAGFTTTTTFSYYPDDKPKGIQYGNGLTANYTYNRLRLTNQISLNDTSVRPAKQLLALNYRYNMTGTVASVSGQVNGTSLSEQYRYDALQRLVNSYLRTGSTTTTLSNVYDNVGNRLSQNLNGVATSYNYNLTNYELTGSTNPTTTYSYNGGGELTSKTTATNRWTYGWDVQGDLLQVANGSGTQAYYAYDGLGRRVESRENPSTSCTYCQMYYAYLGTETLSEIQPSESKENDYIFANGLRIARLLYQGGIQSIVYYHEDALGNTRLVTSNSKSVLFADNYQPYGQDNSASGSETYKFTGKPYSTATGLYYDYQRWYDPSIGRFISQDPLAGRLSDPQSLNPYIYVENLPTVLTDPSGMDDCSWNPLSWGGCLSNAWQGTVNWWNGLPSWAQTGLEVAATIGIVVGAIALFQPEILVAALPWLFGGGLGAASLGCQEGGCEDLVAAAVADFSSESIDQAVADVLTTRGGALSIELGNIGEGGAMSTLFEDFQVQPEEMALRQTFDLGEKALRPDITVEESGAGFSGMIESKWGFVRYSTGSREVQQAIDYAQLAASRGLPLYYKLYSGADPRFLALLFRLGVRFL